MADEDEEGTGSVEEAELDEARVEGRREEVRATAEADARARGRDGKEAGKQAWEGGRVSSEEKKGELARPSFTSTGLTSSPSEQSRGSKHDLQSLYTAMVVEGRANGRIWVEVVSVLMALSWIVMDFELAR